MMINNNLLNENDSSGCSGLAIRHEGDFFFFFFLQVWVGAEGKEGLTS